MSPTADDVGVLGDEVFRCSTLPCVFHRGGRCWGVGCWGIGLYLECFTEADDVGVLGVGVLDFTLSVSQRRTMLGCWVLGYWTLP